MKKLVFLLVSIFSLFSTPASARIDDDRPVGFGQLPAAARQFIRTHFPDVKLTLATVDREFMETTYDVIFTDGTQIEFNSGGQWKEIECRGSFVPERVLPQEIAVFLREHYSGARVRGVERDRHGYELSLDDRRELRFDSHGNFRGNDD